MVLLEALITRLPRRAVMGDDIQGDGTSRRVARRIIDATGLSQIEVAEHAFSFDSIARAVQ